MLDLVYDIGMYEIDAWFDALTSFEENVRDRGKGTLE
jgi:hypothetical protein